MLDKFLHTKAEAEQMTDCSPISDKAKVDEKGSRIRHYKEERSRVDSDTTSRLRQGYFPCLMSFLTFLRSPYLTSGVISARACIRATMELLESTTVEGSRGHNIGMWVQEVGM